MAATVEWLRGTAPAVAGSALPATPVPLSTLQAHGATAADAALGGGASGDGASNGAGAGANGPRVAEMLCWGLERVRCVLGNGTHGTPGLDRGVGTLYIGAEHLTWWNAEAKEGLRFDYRSIFIHAITRDTAAYPAPCIYCQLGAPSDGVDEGYRPEGDDDDDDDDTDGTTLRPTKDGTGFLVTEARFEPSDPQQLDQLFAAISTGQSLHPDPVDDNDDEDAEGPAFFGGDTGDLNEVQQARLAHLESIFQAPTDAELAAMATDGGAGDDDGDDAFDDAEAA